MYTRENNSVMKMDGRRKEGKKAPKILKREKTDTEEEVDVDI